MSIPRPGCSIRQRPVVRPARRPGRWARSCRWPPSAACPTSPPGAMWPTTAALPVIVDGAAAFDALASAPCRSPSACTPPRPSRPARAAMWPAKTHGFIDRVRACPPSVSPARGTPRHPASNAKLSEYGAAVALASLDGWQADRARFGFAAQHLRVAAGADAGDHASSPAGACAGSPASASSATRPAAPTPWLSICPRCGVDTRRLVGRADATPSRPSRIARDEPLPVTERLAASTLGLPYFIDIDEPPRRAMVDALHEALSGAWVKPPLLVFPGRHAGGARVQDRAKAMGLRVVGASSLDHDPAESRLRGLGTSALRQRARASTRR